MDAVSVGKMVLENDLYYRGRVILTYKKEYPQFHSEKHIKNIIFINRYYRKKALAMENYYKNSLYYDAVAQAEQLAERNIRYEAVVVFEVTYNRQCALSLYIDKYEYTGGAHGLTTRRADTWNVQTGRRLLLRDLFASGTNYRTFTIQSVNEQIQQDIDSGNNIYFENYRELVVINFSEEDFYLTHGGVTVFYQLYEIAPYVAGIPTFTMPYEYGVLVPPRCKKSTLLCKADSEK